MTERVNRLWRRKESYENWLAAKIDRGRQKARAAGLAGRDGSEDACSLGSPNTDKFNTPHRPVQADSLIRNAEGLLLLQRDDGTAARVLIAVAS